MNLRISDTNQILICFLDKANSSKNDVIVLLLNLGTGLNGAEKIAKGRVVIQDSQYRL